MRGRSQLHSWAVKIVLVRSPCISERRYLLPALAWRTLRNDRSGSHELRQTVSRHRCWRAWLPGRRPRRTASSRSPTLKRLADALCTLIADPARRKAMGEHNRRRVLETMTWDRVIDRLEEIYIATIDRKRRRRDGREAPAATARAPRKRTAPRRKEKRCLSRLIPVHWLGQPTAWSR